MIKVLATDLDGTFLSHEGTVSEGNRRALIEARARGLEVIFVTGRPPRWLPSIIEQTEFDGTIVSANGGIVIDAKRREVVQTFPMTTDAAREGITQLLKALPGLEFGVERSTVGMKLVMSGQDIATTGREISPNNEFVMTAGYQSRFGTPGDVPIGDIFDLVAGDRAVKIVARPPVGNTMSADELLEIFDSSLDGILQPTHSNLYDVLIEISALGVTKGSTLAKVVATKGYEAADVAAVGDMPNDAPMLEWAGSPFVVANAHPSLLAEFHNRIGANDEDAVGALLLDLAGEL
jgi:hydroxymethylpyrimidine pyrophosphatase-like HAD family hydrolase